jgi:subtilisin family serine protease
MLTSYWCGAVVRRGAHILRRLGWLLVSVAVMWAAAAAGEDVAADAHGLLYAHPTHLIVKYRPTVNACTDCFLTRSLPSASATDSASLNRLNVELGVRRARPLFLEEHGGTTERRGTYAASVEAARQRFPSRSARAQANASVPDLSNVFVLDLPAGADVAAAARRYAADPDVEYAQPDYRRQAADEPVVPDDPFYSSSGSWGQSYADLWGLHITQAGWAWNTSIGAGVVVAVIDTGVDYNHPDLATNMWTNPGEIPGNHSDDDNNGFVDDVYGWDFVQNDNKPYDVNGHGTHVAGTVAAIGDNNLGVVGMAWGARIMAVRGFNAQGMGYDSNLAKAIVYAAQNGADVLNNSWGGAGRSSVLEDAVATATGLGAVVIAAAGNSGTCISSADNTTPANIPDVIAVGATQPDDTWAPFSLTGNALSVAAPGTYILSLKAAVASGVLSAGPVVNNNYLVLSGTSMATPHVAGLAALLLSAQPELTPDEVRWHLELNADQIGHPGYENQPWNPYVGWGRINAQRVFDPVPVTTRSRTHAIERHALPDSTTPATASLDFSFTTHDPVAWSVSAPSWLPPDTPTGSGDSVATLSLDTTGLSPGDYSGQVAVNAPAAVDGGASVDATVHVHSDPRIGPEVQVGPAGGLFTGGDGLGALVLRVSGYPHTLESIRVDSSGNPTGDRNAVYTFDRRIPQSFNVASDGRNFLVTWAEDDTTLRHNFISGYQYVKAIRLAPTGEPLDAGPIIVESHRVRRTSALKGPQVSITGSRVGFDGQAYNILVSYWFERGNRRDISKIYLRRLGRDGTLSTKRRLVYPLPGTALPQYTEPQIGCIQGGCLVAWLVSDDEAAPSGKYIRKVYGLRLTGDGVISGAPFRLLTDADSVNGVATDGHDYVVLASRLSVYPCSYFCAFDPVAARVTGAGVPLDLAGTRLSNGWSPVYRYTSDLTFDGAEYVATFFTMPGPRPEVAGSYYDFAAPFRADGTVMDTELEGLLLNFSPTLVGVPHVVAAPDHATVLWLDDSDVAIYAAPILAHPRTPGFPDVAIGSIGPRTVAENSPLAFALTAPALDPATTTFRVTGMPAGAVFDAPTHIFRWIPQADQAGVSANVHFEASDATNTVSEDVTLTVSEASVSITGTTRASDGTPVPGLAVKLRGANFETRTAWSDASGGFRFENLPPATYKIRLVGTGRAGLRRIPVGTSDLKGIDLISPN